MTDSPYLLFEQGNMLLQLGKYHDAEKKFAKSLTIDPSYFYSLWGLGIALVEQRKAKEGISIFKKGLAFGNETDIFYNALASTYYNEKEIKEAEKITDEWLSKFPNSPDAHMYKARIAIETTKNEKKIFYHLKESLRIDPFNTETIDCMANAIWRFKQDKKAALDQFKVALRKDPADPYLRNNHGVLLLEMGDAKQALEEFKQALKLKPNLPMLEGNIGRALSSTHPLLFWAYKLNVIMEKFLDKIPFRRRSGIFNYILTFIILRLALSLLASVSGVLAVILIFGYVFIAVYLFFGYRIMLFAFKRGWIHYVFQKTQQIRIFVLS
jgi:tetratricopeptide (TPR) repeat protein